MKIIHPQMAQQRIAGAIFAETKSEMVQINRELLVGRRGGRRWKNADVSLGRGARLVLEECQQAHRPPCSVCEWGDQLIRRLPACCNQPCNNQPPGGRFWLWPRRNWSRQHGHDRQSFRLSDTDEPNGVGRNLPSLLTRLPTSSSSRLPSFISGRTRYMAEWRLGRAVGSEDSNCVVYLVNESVAV